MAFEDPRIVQAWESIAASFKSIAVSYVTLANNSTNATASLKRLAKFFAPGPAVRLALKILIGGKTLSTNAFSLTDIQQLTYQIPNNFLDEDNNPTSAPAGAVADIISSDPTILEVVPDPTPVGSDASGNAFFATGTIVAAGKLGTANISGQVNDANGNLLFPINGLPLAGTVNPSAATSGPTIVIGQPTTQPGK